MDIKFNGVTKKYEPNITALENVFLQIDSGEFVYLVGETGSGKTTLLRCITREVLPTRGQITVGGNILRKLKRVNIALYRRDIGVVFQDFKLLQNLTAFENVAFVLEVLGYSSRNIGSRVSEVLKTVGIWHRRNMHPPQLSGGEQQRLAIARAIVNQPAILLADEPTGNLDSNTADEIMQLISKINAEGTTVLMATHNQYLVDTYRHRVIEISKGRIVRDENKGKYVNSETTDYDDEDDSESDDIEIEKSVTSDDKD
jgi:cell division transport system ATP-binding protein